MAAPQSKGRMIRKDISRSKGFASLSRDSQVLFLMCIPHFSSHGKLNGNPNFIKGEVCPRIKWLTVNIIKKCLKEISKKTNVKWFRQADCFYLHALSWGEHQKLDRTKLGADELPDYPGTADASESQASRRLLYNQSLTAQGPQTHKVKEQVKGEEKAQEKNQVKDEVSTFLSSDDEKAVRAELAKNLNHTLGSEANNVALNDLVKKVAQQKNVRNPTAYTLQAAKTISKPMGKSLPPGRYF